MRGAAKCSLPDVISVDWQNTERLLSRSSARQSTLVRRPCWNSRLRTHSTLGRNALALRDLCSEIVCFHDPAKLPGDAEYGKGYAKVEACRAVCFRPDVISHHTQNRAPSSRVRIRHRRTSRTNANR